MMNSVFFIITNQIFEYKLGKTHLQFTCKTDCIKDFTSIKYYKHTNRFLRNKFLVKLYIEFKNYCCLSNNYNRHFINMYNPTCLSIVILNLRLDLAIIR